MPHQRHAVPPGRRFAVVWAVASNGSSPAKEFFDSQTESDQAKLLALFKRLADHGEIANREKFRKLGDKAKGSGSDLWEFKSFQLRILGDFRPGGYFVLAHGTRKKQDKLNPADIEKAARILSEHDGRSGLGR